MPNICQARFKVFLTFTVLKDWDGIAKELTSGCSGGSLELRERLFVRAIKLLAVLKLFLLVLLLYFCSTFIIFMQMLLFLCVCICLEIVRFKHFSTLTTEYLELTVGSKQY